MLRSATNPVPAACCDRSSPCTSLLSFSPFVTVSLDIKRRKSTRRCQSTVVKAVSIPDVSELTAQLSSLTVPGVNAASFDTLIASLHSETIPVPIRTITMDVADVVALTPTIPGMGRLALLYYALFTRPGPLTGALDFFFLNTIAKATSKKWTVSDFTLRERLGGGNYGQVFEGLRTLPGEERTYSKQLTPDQKKRRVILKRVNLDKTGIRANFLTAGTIAKGAAETGVVEAYMCQKVNRNPVVQKSVAEYLGSFTAEGSEGGFTKGTQWLVWTFESDSTLADACEGKLGNFPECLAPIMVGNTNGMTPEKRDALVVKSIMKKLLTGLDRLHSIGIVHRDVKTENVLVTGDGRVLLIDFGAAVDMCTGVNFNPLYGMLDPRYAPPEDLVMPKEFPRAPPPFLATLLSPFAWALGRPDLFDSYSAGVVFLQLAIPELRTAAAQKNLNTDLARYEYDLDVWREVSTKARICDFTLLDRNGKSGWDLAKKLLKPRNSLNRGRLSTGEALGHRYFYPEF